ncbi:MAG: RICIN domain-containing protein, partial [Clostridia bacterium]|nr:RICIN domain-containing protein [Clostridia bacterium]
EIESLREESSKHFQLEDGSYQAIAYGAAVHRMDADGKWRDIDNRLYADRTESGRYSTQDGRFSFAESVSADELYTIDDGHYHISFGAILEGSPRSTAVIENHADRKTAAEGLTGEEKLEALKTIDNTTKITYYTVNDGVDLEYIISGNDVKENIIISQPTTKSVFTYRLKLIGLSAELEDNTISLKNKDGETVYLLTAPYMYDSAGAESAKVSYALEKDNEGCVITIDADSDWINDPERVFPVTVDPSVTKKILLDTYINSAYPTTSYGSQTSVVIGSTKIAYMFALMPSIPTYADINYATLSLRYYFASSSGGADIGLYRCLHTWSESMTWNDTNSWSNRGLSTTRTAIATATASSNINQNNPGTVSLNVTPLVQQWYAGGKNYGFGLKYEGGSLTNVYVHTYESTSSFRAYFTISYETATDLTVENGTYFIKNKHTEKYADTCQQTYEGGYIEQYEFTADTTQRWTFKYAHFGNYYTIKSEDSTTEYYMGVLGDSTSADVNVVMRQGLDSNGTRTMSAGMLWSVSNTASGAYKIQAITGEASDLALCVGAYVFNSNGVDIEQRLYYDDVDYKDEWFIVTPHNSVELEAQHQTNWCWAASAIMSSKIYMLSPISQEIAAVYEILDVLNYSPTNTQISNANQPNTVGGTEDALEFILGSDNVYSKWEKIYSESTLRSMIDNNNPVIISRGWYRIDGTRNGGHDTIIYGYHWDEVYNIYVYDIYDPSPVNIGSSYYRSYQSICNGNSPAIPTDPNDNGIWEGIVVYEIGPYTNTIDWPGA